MAKDVFGSSPVSTATEREREWKKQMWKRDKQIKEGGGYRETC